MVGTFGGALEARKINTSEGALVANVRGEVETEDRVLVLKRIHVAFKLVTDELHRETIERIHSVFAGNCPVYRSLKDAILITSSVELVPAA